MAAVENYTNNATTTVASGGTDAPAQGTSQTWTVTSSASFPAASTGSTQFHVGDPAKPTELITVTNVSGATWTVTRGAESTTPVAHAAGFTVDQVITAGGLNALVSSAAATAYAVVTGGTAVAAPFQQVASVGGSGQVLTSNGAALLPSWQTSSAGFSNPMTTLGDVITGGTTGTPLRLAGNLTAAKNFLTSTGNGGTAAAPAWGTIASADVPTLNQNTTGTSSNVTGTVAIVNGGTGGTTKSTGFNALSPNAALGDITYGSGVNASTNLAGNATATKNFLTSTGSGGSAAAPSWGTIAAADVPTLNQNTTGTALNVTGTVATINGGTGLASLTTYAVVTGGTSSTTALQQVTSLGTSGQFLTSGGAGTLPTWQAPTGFVPADAGYLEWNYDPVGLNTNTALGGTANVYLNRVNIRTTRSVTNVAAYLGALGGALTTGANFAGLYSSAGSLIGTSADQTTAWNTGGVTGAKTIALTGGPFSVPAGFVWVALMYNGGTAPSFGRSGNLQVLAANVGFVAATARFAFATGGTILPSSITPSSNTLQASEYWVAVS